MKRTIFKFYLVVIMCFFSLTPNVFSLEINDYSSDFSIELIPGNPHPNQTVSAKVVSYQFDIDRSSIEWVFNDKIIAKGVGRKNAGFTLPGFGKESKLTVNITTNNGVDVSKTKIFSGSDIDFLWEAKNVVPAGYKGKALAGHKSIVKITALPHLFVGGSPVNSSSLIYDWTLNYKKLPDSSGIRKNTFLMQLSDFGDYSVGVTVSSLDKRASFQKYFHISAESMRPKLVFYQDNPLEGPLYGKAIKNNVLLKKIEELSIRAEPYFLNKGVGEIDYNWQVNGNNANSSFYPNTLSLKTGGDSGEAEISLKVEKRGEDFTQTLNDSINIEF